MWASSGDTIPVTVTLGGHQVGDRTTSRTVPEADASGPCREDHHHRGV